MSDGGKRKGGFILGQRLREARMVRGAHRGGWGGSEALEGRPCVWEVEAYVDVWLSRLVRPDARESVLFIDGVAAAVVRSLGHACVHGRRGRHGG